MLVTLVAVALLPMVAQTSLPQAADQFCRAYRQLLIYDHEEYENEYNYDNHEGWLMAGSVVMSYDVSAPGFVVWMGVLSDYAADGLGYEDGSAKWEALNSAQPLIGATRQRIGAASTDFVDGIVECMDTKAFKVAGAIVGGVALGLCLFATPAIGLAAAGYGAIGLASVCLLIGVSAFLRTLIFGSIFICFPVRRKILHPIPRW